MVNITLQLRDSLIALAKQAGAAIMDVYEGDDRKDFGATTKIDNSPLTQADLRVRAAVARTLRRIGRHSIHGTCALENVLACRSA
jgi:3'(2'), 5'-bisphosphate nucleotidase